MQFSNDPRTVLTLDAGGTGFEFSAIRGNTLLFEPISAPSEADNLDRCLTNIVAGFEKVRSRRKIERPVAISFAFPGPADYTAGIIGEPPNLPAFRGGVPLAAMLEERFGLPVFVNNDGDLFTYGEAIAGFLPYVNGLLADAGSSKRYRNLFGLTIGTGLGGGLAIDGQLFVGDNSSAAEAWLLRNKLDPLRQAEEGASIRAVRRSYAALAQLDLADTPDPKEICEIGMGRAPGHRNAAIEAFRRLGEVVGDVLAQALTLVDGLAVIGGGISAASPLFLPAVVHAMNDVYRAPGGESLRRLVPTAYNLEDSASRDVFLKGQARTLQVPGSTRVVSYDPLPRTAVGISRLETSKAVAIGAYAFALKKLGKQTYDRLTMKPKHFASNRSADIPFKRSWWLRGRHAQTIWPALFRRVRIAARKERLELPDGDFAQLDWVGESGPIVIVLPGLQGDIQSAYLAGLLRQCNARRWRGVLLNHRGRIEPNRLARSYHCGMTDDIDYFVRQLSEREPETPIAVVGFSLGANICLRWLGECGQRGEAPPVAAAVAVSAPFYLGPAAKMLERGFSRVYQWNLLRSLRQDVLRKFDTLADALQLSRRELPGLNTFYKFDARITAPLHGFDSADDYYARTRSDVLLKQIAVPTLIVNAHDDPLIPPELVPPAGRLSEHVTLEITRGGGHIGFVTGRWPWSARYWLDIRIPQFLEKFLRTA